MKQKYNLKCVNDGDPFEMPMWTPEKHEKALAKLAIAQEEYKWTEEEANKQFKYYVIYETLLEIDPNCKFEDVPKHPATVMDLFNAVYNEGREDIYYKEDKKDFRKGKKPQKDKK